MAPILPSYLTPPSPYLTRYLTQKRRTQVLAGRANRRKGNEKGPLRKNARGLKVEAAGIAPEVSVPQVVSPHDTCVEQGCRWLHYGCTDAALTELLDSWPSLPAHITQTIMTLVRSSRPVR